MLDASLDLSTHGVLTLAARGTAARRFPALGFRDRMAEALWDLVGRGTSPPLEALLPAWRRTAAIDALAAQWLENGAASAIVELEAELSTRLPWLALRFPRASFTALDTPQAAVLRGWLLPHDSYAELSLPDTTPAGLRALTHLIPKDAVLIAEHTGSRWTARVLENLVPLLGSGARLILGGAARSIAHRRLREISVANAAPPAPVRAWLVDG